MSSITATEITVVPILFFNIPNSSKIIALTGTEVTDKSNPINNDSINSNPNHIDTW